MSNTKRGKRKINIHLNKFSFLSKVTYSDSFFDLQLATGIIFEIEGNIWQHCLLKKI